VHPTHLLRGRVDFQDVRVTGQVPRAGAIYLIARRRSELRSMVRQRDHYRREILRTVGF